MEGNRLERQRHNESHQEHTSWLLGVLMSVGSSKTTPALHHGNWPGGRLIIMLTIAHEERRRLKSSGSRAALLFRMTTS